MSMSAKAQPIPTGPALKAIMPHCFTDDRYFLFSLFFH